MALIESPFCDLAWLKRSAGVPSTELRLIHSLRLRPRHIAGHELDGRILEILAAHILERHPSDEVERVALFGGDDVVSRLPAHAAREVGELRLTIAGAVRPKSPQ